MKLLGRHKDHVDKDTASLKGEKDVNTSKTSEKEVQKTGAYRRVVLRPLVTEKAAHLTSLGKYVFEVATKVTRIEVQQAIADMYGVRPKAVHIQNVRGEMVRFGRHLGRRKAWKKAIVTLPEGKKIDVHEGV